MDVRYALSLVLNAHLPYVREYISPTRKVPPNEAALHAAGQTDHAVKTQESRQGYLNLAPGSLEESWFFEAVSETYLPLLDMFSRLEKDKVPFRLGLSFSPLLGQMLDDELLLKKYVAFLDHQIDFGREELERLAGRSEQLALAQGCLDRVMERRAAFANLHEGGIFKALDHYRKRGNIEFLAAPATHAFFPFLCSFPEAVQAQIEVALTFYRYTQGVCPQGFWLPELGWTNELSPLLRSYGFNYTIADSHGVLFGDPPPSRGTFFPVKTPQGLVVFARDFIACSEIAAMKKNPLYRDNNHDAGYELPAERLGPFLANNGARCQTGYKYWNSAGAGSLYDHAGAQAAAEGDAKAFLENSCRRLESASQKMDEIPLSLCAFNADCFGRRWHEGTHFLETLFRLAAESGDIQFAAPSEYLDRFKPSVFEVTLPEFSTWGENGYAEACLDSSNDWIYRHLIRAIDRMVELADRFTEDSGLKERALNQAAREILLAQASDWPVMLYRQECTDFARYKAESAMRNFTTIYEALGSNYISTEWLTGLERRHNIFPNINYRVFRRKR
ncbi:MAG: DUF1957 domain-containing protein [Treponema sp.]|nr:DUF1957 domain-containing protein [Treponema sp.]